MSRRSVRWKRVIAQAGGEVNKVLPRNTTGHGEYLVGMAEVLSALGNSHPPKRGQGKGTPCSADMSPEKEARVRKLKG